MAPFVKRHFPFDKSKMNCLRRSKNVTLMCGVPHITSRVLFVATETAIGEEE